VKEPPVRIWVDSREQLPWSFPGHEVVRAALHAGDYSVEGLTDKVAIERKSLADFLSSITWGRERFEREMERAAGYARFCIFVEAHRDDLYDGAYQARVNPKAVIGSINSIHARWNIATFCHGSRANAEADALTWLTKCSKHLAHLRKESAA
jgi:ERCC4-type nuclease